MKAHVEVQEEGSHGSLALPQGPTQQQRENGKKEESVEPSAVRFTQLAQPTLAARLSSNPRAPHPSRTIAFFL